MEIALADWLNLIFRWLHLITGIAWIGTSFYFIFLDLSLRKRRQLPPGVGGEAWNVHSGGFYLMQKYTVAPEQLPDELHWFKYEAYFTFLSGFALMSVIYYWGAESFLIDKEIADLSQFEAILMSIGFLAGGWIVYDVICRIPLFERNSLLLSVAVFILILLVAWGATNVFSGRAAFVHVDKDLLETQKCDKAFMLTNSIDDAWWNNDDVTPMFDGDGCRSTSVGDQILVGNTKYMCSPFGWEIV